MRIAVSARGLSRSDGGVKEYIKNLILQFAEIDNESEFFFYYSDSRQLLGLDYPNVNEVVLRSAPNLIWDHVILPIRLKIDKIEITLFPKGVVPVISPGRLVVTEHDLGYFFPALGAYKLSHTVYAKLMIPRSVKKADAVLADSRHTRGDILRFIEDVKGEKITTVYLAAPNRDDAECGPDFRMRLDKLSPYIFFSGALSPRKNLGRALEAFELIKDKIPHNFVMTGGQQWGSDFVDGFIKARGLEDRVIRLGYLSDGELAQAYRDAAVYLMPSLYEGFSMTVLEAMQAGCLVVASNVASHPEVVGEAGILFDPYNVEDMAKAVLWVATDHELQSNLREKGFLQAARFSWRKCAEETLAVMRHVCERD